jgi:cytochrome d ubiquinol oxidase subunit II
MHDIWFAVLGLLLGGYFIGEGYAFGLGLLLPLVGTGDRDRRTALASLGPFFLGNEVWLVGAAGVFTAAFPRFEGQLYSGLYPLIVCLLVGIALRDTALHFRSRRPSSTWRRRWDRILVTGSAALSVSWGLVVGNLVQGVPTAPSGLLNPYALLCGLTLPTVFALHAAAFLAMRTRGTELAGIAVARGRQLLLLTVPLVCLTVAAGFGTLGVRSASAYPGWAVALSVVLLVAVSVGAVLLRAARPGSAFALTSVGAALPVLLAGLALTSAMRSGTADSTTLHLLDLAALPIVPVIVLYQGWMWRTFRAPVDGPGHW